MLTVTNVLIYVFMGVLVVGSLLPLSSNPHWFIRGWDFPRVQIVACAIATAVLFVAINAIAGRLNWTASYIMGGLAAAIVLWHMHRILPYTPLLSKQAETWEDDGGNLDAGKNRLRVLVSNVQEENDCFDLWRDTVLKVDADVMVLAEVDERWEKTIKSLSSQYPHQIIHPQSNWYGMALISRLPIQSHKIRFVVQDDIPSIDATILLPSGQPVRIVGVHPRPPEPIRDNDATARDAELVLWGRELVKDSRPVVIGGDLNDVAWSQSTRLFLRLSQLLDPRRGRGFFNSFHTRKAWMRFPLDHVFHSDHFSIRSLKRLPYVGSDHFPIFIDLQCDPEAQQEADPLETKQDDLEESQERIQRAEEEGMAVKAID